MQDRQIWINYIAYVHRFGVFIPILYTDLAGRIKYNIMTSEF